jgi:hypothetical protein
MRGCAGTAVWISSPWVLCAFPLADVGEAFLVLFKIATLSGWGDTTRTMIATRGESEPPGMVYTYLSFTPPSIPLLPWHL